MPILGRPILGRVCGLIAAAALAVGLAAPAAAQDLPTLRLGTLAGGTSSWELAVIRDHGLDVENGFRLETQDYAGNPATHIAIQGGEVDAIVTDWLWAAQQDATGLDLTFVPYSTAVGGLLVAGDSPAESLVDLRGQKIAIAGDPVDKSWLILRALGLNQGIDLAAETEQIFAAAPLVMQAGLSGEAQGAVNLWHFMAKMKAAGMRELVSISDAAAELGLDPDTPLLGYAISKRAVADKPEVVDGLARASRAAKEILATDDAAWEEIRPLMNAANDAEFEALREGWRAGIPPEGPVDPAAAAKLFAVLAEIGGTELTLGLEALPEGLFYTGD
ncbi:ABC transporter substrate-binding protein [Paracoccus sp. S-4012]|uniref:ABC transporter substrate-binding protein n=1 Tax=Paracoccus sp. S-4012 TaxID=2665648 RepID=UPI0012AF76FC|nr:ABC transporter substrate-binding protein [Paracoccus sp. S-4012]MRX51552.1 ABC transporter substrate-binding protein [Paracoccus sp. S-4012]